MEKRISGTTTLLAVIGSPVSHSASPLMHNCGIEHLGLDYAYLAFEINEEQVKDFMNTVRLLKIKGFNATMPCKMEVARQVDEVEAVAEIIEACNTVVNENGKLIGYNTDGIGFIRNLEDYGVSIKDKVITLMGGGGAGAAFFVQMAIDGTRQINIFNRKGSNFDKLMKKKEQMKEIAPDCILNVYDLEDEEALYESIRESDILVNATNVGMEPKPDESLIHDVSVYREDLVVADVIYNPKETKMMKDAKAAGVKTVIGGKGMLFWQGVEAFKLFTGYDMPVDEVKKVFFAE